MRRWFSAGAGSGKTERLTDQVVEALDGADGARFAPEEILVLTYTVAATRELRQRVRLKLLARGRAEGAARADRIVIANFHGFANGFLAREFTARGLGCGIAVLSAGEAAERKRERLHAFVSAQAAGHPDEWRRALELLGFEALLGWLDCATREASARPESFAAFLAALPGRADAASAARAAAVEAAIRAIAPLPRPAGAVGDHLRVLDGALASLRDGRWPDGVRAIAETAGALDLGAGAFAGFPSLTKTAVVSAVQAARRAARGALLELALEPLFPRIGGWLERNRAASLAEGRLDFDELLALTAAWCREPATAARLAKRHRCILVDEAQDTDPVQATFVAELSRALGEAGRVIVVGDEKQAIYRFRGADPDSYRRLHRELGAPRPEALTGNYRSRPEILSALHALADRGLFDRPLRGEEKEGDPPALRALNAPQSPPFWRPEHALTARKPQAGEPRLHLIEGSLARFIGWLGAFLGHCGLDWGDVLWLAHKRDLLDEAGHSLARAGVEVIRPGRGLWARESARALANAATAAADPLNGAALLAALRSPLFQVDDGDLLAACAGAGAPRRLTELRRAGRATLPPALAEALDALDALADRAGDPADALRALADRALAPALTNPAYPGGAAERQALDAALALAAASPGLIPFAREAARLRDHGDETALRPDPGRRGATLMTIHGAKGLGEKVVVLDGRMTLRPEPKGGYFKFTPEGDWCALPATGLESLAWESRFAPEEFAALRRDQSALAYVALTRAKEQMIVWAEDFQGAGNWRISIARRIAETIGWTGDEREIPDWLAESAGHQRLEAGPPPVPLEIPEVPPSAAAAPPPAPRAAAGLRYAAVAGRAATMRRGSLVHKALERWDFSAGDAPRAARAAAAELTADPALAEAVAALLGRLAATPEARILRDAAGANRLWRELTLFIPGAAEDGAPARAPAYRRGVADLVWMDEQGRYAIVDYKTGEPDAETLDGYREQLAGYRAALAAAGFGEARLRLWLVDRAEMTEIS